MIAISRMPSRRSRPADAVHHPIVKTTLPTRPSPAGTPALPGGAGPRIFLLDGFAGPAGTPAVRVTGIPAR